ncbi:MAG: hypothetical protein WBO57_12600, partial [Gammaproteobacteria bacterium]
FGPTTVIYPLDLRKSQRYEHPALARRIHPCPHPIDRANPSVSDYFPGPRFRLVVIRNAICMRI